MVVKGFIEFIRVITIGYKIPSDIILSEKEITNAKVDYLKSVEWLVETGKFSFSEEVEVAEFLGKYLRGINNIPPEKKKYIGSIETCCIQFIFS